jgi:predicted MFS family arabinose efflux permease
VQIGYKNAMAKLNSLSESVEDLGAAPETVEPAALDSAPIIEPDWHSDSNDERNERTFFRGRLLRQVRLFVEENGPLAALFAVVFVNLVGFGIVVPLMPFFAESLHAEAWKVALMFTAYSLGQFFAEPYCGRLSDRIGRKPILIVTTALSVLFYCCLAFAPNIWIAILIRFFSGLSSGNLSTIQGYVSDVSRPEQRATRMSMIFAAFSIGFVIGPFIGGILSHDSIDGNQFRMPMIGAAILSAAATFGVMLFVRESRKRDAAAPPTTARADLGRAAHDALKSPTITRLILATLCYQAALAGLESTFALWVEKRYHWGPKEIGVVFLFIGIAAAAMQMIFMRPLVRKWGEARVLAAGLFVFGSSFALQSVNHIGWLIIPIVMFGTLGQAVIFSNICAIISMMTAPDRQGAMQGLNMSTGAIARITGPVVAGVLFTTIGPDAPLWMGAAMTIPAGLLALGAGRAQKKAANN